MRYFLRFFLLLTFSWLYALLVACSTLPMQSTPITPQYSDLQFSQSSQLSQRIQQQRQQHATDLTGYHLLSNPNEALSARFALIQHAEKTLDIQYYIWKNDQIGMLTFYYLLQAADRGVKIRLLIDDNNAKQIEHILLAASQHSNIDIKLFNPYRFRKYRAMDMVLDLKRINRRMHNKTFIADHQLSIIGGRNIADEYFNVSETFQFADIDVLLAGQVNDQIVHSFDEYWNHELAYDVKTIVNPRHHSLRYHALRQQLEQRYQQDVVQQNPQLMNIQAHTQMFHEWLAHTPSFTWVKAQLFYDPANKLTQQADETSYLYPQLIQQLQPVTEQLTIVSAYFIPPKTVTQQLKKLETTGVHTKILTNSVAGNDIKGVNAFYNRHRKELLSNGIELYEFLPKNDIQPFMNNGQEVTQSSSSPETFAHAQAPITQRVALHSKTAIFDNEQVFIGSFNLDPRSIVYNSEIGVLLDSPKLATQLNHAFQHQVNQYAWQLTLNAKRQIQWYEQPQDLFYRQEPQTKWWQRWGLRMLGILPLEHMF